MTNLELAFQRGFWKTAVAMGMPAPKAPVQRPLPLAHAQPAARPPTVIPHAPQMQMQPQAPAGGGMGIGGDPRMSLLNQLTASLPPQLRRQYAMGQAQSVKQPGEQFIAKPMV